MWRVVGLETLTVSLADLDTPDSAIDSEEDMGEPILRLLSVVPTKRMKYCYQYVFKIKKKKKSQQ